MSEQSKNQKPVDTMQIAIRAIVMFFGLSMVILGSHAINVQHGSIGNYLKKESKPFVEKVEQRMPNVKWEKMGKLFKPERAKETWQLKTDKLTPKKQSSAQ